MGPVCLSVSATAVVEVVPAIWVQAHDACPQGVLGLMDYRGTPVPVLCPSAVFEGEQPGMQDGHHIIVLQTQGRRLGLPIEELVLDAQRVDQCSPLDISKLFARTNEGALEACTAPAWKLLQARLHEAVGDAPLLARARTVSIPKAAPENGRTLSASLRLSAGGHTYSLSLELVWETVHLPALTQVPGSPPRVAGVCHYRGGILTVIDLPAYLGHSSGPLTPQTRALIVGRDAPELALIVDGVPTVEQVALTTGHAAPTQLDVGALLADRELYATRHEAAQPQES